MIDNPENSTVRCPKCGYIARAGAAACPGCYSQLPTATPDIATPQAKPPKPAGRFGLKFGRKQEAPPLAAAPVEPPAPPRVFAAPAETEEPAAPAEIIGFEAPTLETPEAVQEDFATPPDVFDLPTAVVEEPPLEDQSVAPAVPDLGDVLADYATPEEPATTPPLQPFDVSTLGPEFAEPEQESLEETDFSTPVGYDLSDMTFSEPEPPVASDVDAIPDFSAETAVSDETQEAETAPPVEPEVELGAAWAEGESPAPVGYDLSDFSLPAASAEEVSAVDEAVVEEPIDFAGFEIGGATPVAEEPESVEPVQEFTQEPVDFAGFDIGEPAVVAEEPEAIEAAEPEIVQPAKIGAEPIDFSGFTIGEPVSVDEPEAVEAAEPEVVEPVDFAGFDIGEPEVVAEEPEAVQPEAESGPEPIDFSGFSFGEPVSVDEPEAVEAAEPEVVEPVNFAGFDIGEPAVVAEEPEVIEAAEPEIVQPEAESAPEPIDFSGFSIGEPVSVEEPEAVEAAEPEVVEPVDFAGFDIGEPSAQEPVAESPVFPSVDSDFVDYAAPSEPDKVQDVETQVSEPAEPAEPEAIVPTAAAQQPIPGLEMFDLSDIPGFDYQEAAATVAAQGDSAEPDVFDLIERPTEPQAFEVTEPDEPVAHDPSDSEVSAPPADETVSSEYSTPEWAVPFESVDLDDLAEPADKVTEAIEPEAEETEPVAPAAYDLLDLTEAPPAVANSELPAAPPFEQAVEEQTAPWELQVEPQSSEPVELVEQAPVVESEAIGAEVEEPAVYDFSGIDVVEPVDLSWPETPAVSEIDIELKAPQEPIEEPAIVDTVEAPSIGEPETGAPVVTESVSADAVVVDEAAADTAPMPVVLPERAARRRRERAPKEPRLPKPPKPVGPSLSSLIRPQAQKVSAAIARAAVVVAAALKTAALSSKAFVVVVAGSAGRAVSVALSKIFSRVRKSPEVEPTVPEEAPVAADYGAQTRTAAMLASVKKLPKRVLARPPGKAPKVELPVGELAADSADPTSCGIVETPVASEVIETLHAAWVKTETEAGAAQPVNEEAAATDESVAELAGQAFETAAPWESVDTAVVEDAPVAEKIAASEVWEPISVTQEPVEETVSPSTPEVLVEMAEELAPAATAVTGATTAAKPAGLAAAGAVIAGVFIVPAKAMGGMVKMVGSKLKRSTGLISRYREARKAGSAGPEPAAPRMSEFESGMLSRLATAAQVAAWADELASLNAETERVLIQLSEPNETHHPELENLVETVRLAIRDDARRIQDLKDNPYSLYWNLWLKDEREIMSTDVGSLAQRIEAMGGMEAIRARLVSLRDRYQSSDPKFYAHFGSIVLLYDTYPPDSIKKLAKQAGLTQCGRALAPK